MNIGRNALSDTFTQHLCRFVERQRMYSGYSARNEHDLAHLIAFQFNPIHFKAFQSKYTTYLNLLFCTCIVHTFAVPLMCLRGFLCLQSTKFSPVLCVWYVAVECALDTSSGRLKNPSIARHCCTHLCSYIHCNRPNLRCSFSTLHIGVRQPKAQVGYINKLWNFFVHYFRLILPNVTFYCSWKLLSQRFVITNL